MSGVSWLAEPEEHDYPAAGDYLALIAGPDLVAVLVDGLRRAETVHRKAKDILRASGLPLLPADDPHVDSDLKKIQKGRALSPILLVRGGLAAHRSRRSPTATTGSAPATTRTRTPTSRAAWSTSRRVSDPSTSLNGWNTHPGQPDDARLNRPPRDAQDRQQPDSTSTAGGHTKGA